MKELVYNRKGKSFLIPESWEEVSTRQFIELAGLLHKEDIREAMQCDRLLKIACGTSLFRFLMIPVEIRMNAYEHVLWMVETVAECTEQKIVYYKGLYGPESGFGNLALSEFHHTEMAYEMIVNEGSEAALDELVAILYREPKKKYDIKRNPDGDVRKPFSFTEVAWHKKKVMHWRLEVKQAVLLWYDACRQQLYKSYKPAFTGGKGGSNYYDGLYPMIRSLSGDKYGTFDSVEKMSVIIALMEIVSSKQEEAELKSKYPDLYK